MAETKIRKNAWKGVGAEIGERLLNALKSIRFMVFFLVGIIAIGGVGVWLPPLLDKTSTMSYFESQNVFTYSVAILGTLVIESLLGYKNKDLAALGFMLGFICLLLCFLGYYNEQKGISVWLNVGAVGTLVLFLLANVNDERFDNEEEDSAVDATGYKTADAKLIKDKPNE